MVILKTRLANRHPPVGIRPSETNCHKACYLRAKEGVNMFRIVNTKTNGLLFSSNSIYGIIDLFLMNWGRLPDFTISIDMTNKIITFNNENYTIEYINIATPPRGEET